MHAECFAWGGKSSSVHIAKLGLMASHNFEVAKTYNFEVAKTHNSDSIYLDSLFLLQILQSLLALL
jgi:hypothetical protein